MARTGQKVESLQAENKLYEVFLKHNCKIDDQEVQDAIQEAWGSESEWTREQMIEVLRYSSPAVIDYRIQANNEMLAQYGVDDNKKEEAPPVYYDDEMTDEELFNEERLADFKPTFTEEW